jgi:uncharacterized membrane protein
MASLLLFLLCLQIKHVLIDYVLQTQEQIYNKGTFGNWSGFTHSLEHGLGTLIVIVILAYDAPLLLLIGIPVADVLIHYVIDWTKMNFGCKDMSNKLFWWHLGIDQFSHQVTYLVIAFILFS